MPTVRKGLFAPGVYSDKDRERDEYKAKLSFDLKAGQEEIDAIDRQLAQLRPMSRREAANRGQLSQWAETRQQVEDLQRQRSEKNAYLNQARLLQENHRLSQVGNPDSDAYDKAFEKLSQYAAPKDADTRKDIWRKYGTGYDDLTYEYINGADNGMRREILSRSAMESTWNGIPDTDKWTVYDQMTEDEIGIYNYYYAKEGKAKAKKYLDSIQESLNYRKASGMYTDIENKWALEMLMATAAGVDQFGQGVKNVVNTQADYLPQSSMQMLSGMMREDLADVGPQLPGWLGGGSLGQAAYDTITTTVNMTPSILSSIAANAILPGSGAFVGNATMFASAAGSAYQEALNLGYDKAQARLYSTLVGGSEVGLQAVLGGISALGGTGKMVRNVLNGIDSGLLRVAGKLVASGLSEGLEEGLQEALTPAFKQMALRLDEDVDWGQVAYSALLGALTAGLLEGPNTIAEDRSASKAGRQFLDSGVDLDRLKNLGSTMSADSAAYKLAGKVNENSSAYAIGKLFQEVGASLTKQNQADIQRSLEAKGFTPRQARTNARAFAMVVEGASLTPKQRAAIEGNELLSQAVVEEIINPNSTVNQRTQNYNEMLMDMARKQSTAAPAKASETAPVSSPDTNAEPAKAAPSKVQSVVSTEGGKLTFQMADGTTAAAEDVELGDMAPIYETIAEMGVTSSEANILAQDYAPNTAFTSTEYAAQMRNAYRMGEYGIPMKQAKISSAVNFLSDLQLEHAYNMGRAAAQARTEKAQAAVKQRTVKNNHRAAGEYLDVSELTSAATDERVNQIEAIAPIAEALQIHIKLYASEEVDGKRTTPNGWYDPKTDTIYLDINAGLDGQGTMLFTLAHELTHRIKAWSPAKFKILADFLMEEYGKKGAIVEELINNQLAKAQRTYKDQNLSQEQLYDIAYEEFVADSMEPMLADGKVLEKLRIKDESIWNQLKDYIQEFAEKIRKAYARLKPDSREGQIVLEMKDSIETLEKLFLEGLEDSAQAAAAAQKNTAQQGGEPVRYSMRDYRQQVEEVKNNIYSSSNHVYMGTTPAGIVKILDLPKLPMLTTSQHIYSMAVSKNQAQQEGRFRARSNYHNLGWDTVKRLPEYINNPLMLIKSNTDESNARFVVVTSKVDKTGNPIIVAVEPNGTGKYFDIVLPTNIMLSGYGKKGLNAYVEKAKAENRILYMRKSSQKNQTIPSVQFADNLLSSDYTSNLTEFKKIVKDQFAGTIFENSGLPTIRYSERDPGLQKLSEMTRKELEGIEDDLFSVQELRRIMSVFKEGEYLTESSTLAAARSLMKAYKAEGDAAELTSLLLPAYHSLLEQDRLTVQDVQRALAPAVDWLMENRKQELDADAQEFLGNLRKTRIYFDPKQKKEIQYQLGTAKDVQRAFFGKVVVSDTNSTSLESMWLDWNAKFPGFFPEDTNALEMPMKLLEAITDLKNLTAESTRGDDLRGLEQDMLRQVYDRLFTAVVFPDATENLETPLDTRLKNQKASYDRKVSSLQKKLAAAQQQLQEVRRKHNENMAALKTEHEKVLGEVEEHYQSQKQTLRELEEERTVRNRVKRNIWQLNSMLLRPTKNRHIPEELKLDVIATLETINPGSLSGKDQIDKILAQIDKTSNPYKRDELLQKIWIIQSQQKKMDNNIAFMKTLYEKMRKSKDPSLAYVFDEDLNAKLQEVAEKVGNTTLDKMNLEELQMVDQVMQMLRHQYLDAQNAFATGKKARISDIGDQTIEEMGPAKKKKQLKSITVFGHEIDFWSKIKAFGFNNLKPIYAFKFINSPSMTMLHDNLEQGEKVWAKDMKEANDYRRESESRFGSKKWDLTSRMKFTDTQGNQFELDLMQRMSLYAYSKRAQALPHLEKFGFQFAPETKIIEKKKGVFEVAYEYTTADTYKVDKATLKQISDTLTPQQRAFADRMQDYLSKVMGAKGNETSIALHGVALFNEESYFPIFGSRQYLDKNLGKVAGKATMKNKGFTNATIEDASNPIYLRGFMDVWAYHVNEMSEYHGLALPLEDITRVRNYKKESDGKTLTSVEGAILSTVGKEARDYIDQLIKDVNGGVIGDPRAALGKSLITRHKKASVIGSLSVAIQQPTSIVRAWAVIPPKYFFKAKTDNLKIATPKKHAEKIELMEKYSGLVIIKRMGGFDTSTGRSAQNYLTSVEYEGIKERLKGLATDESYRDEFFGKLAEWGDELAWVAIWEAAEKEVADKHRGLLTSNREQFYKLVAQRFDQAITETQVYDSVFSRSGNMRSKDLWMNSVMSFMAEPTTVTNMAVDAYWKWSRGDKRGAANELLSILGSVTLNSMLVSVIYAMWDDDEDETFDEKYWSRVATELIDGLNPITYIPILKDIWSLFQGYDVERADMSLWSDLVGVLNRMAALSAKDPEDMDDAQRAEHEKKCVEINWDVVDTILSILNTPAKNIRRDVNGILNTFRTFSRGQTTTQKSLWDEVLSEVQASLPGGKEASKQDKLYNAILAGDSIYVQRLKAGYKSETSYNQAVRKAIRENDPRIRQAALARSSGNLKEYSSIAKAFLAEKNFTQDDFVAAVNAEINAMNKGESSSAAAKAKSLYTSDDFKSALISGSSMTKNIREELIRIDQLNGKTKEEAEKSFISTARDASKEAFLDGSLSRTKTEKALVDYCGRTQDEAKADVEYWAFKRDYPDIYADDSWFDKYYREVADSGMDIGTYMNYRNQVKDITGEGKQERRWAVIDSLPISKDQKDTLHFAEGWAESSLYKSPWH